MDLLGALVTKNVAICDPLLIFVGVFFGQAVCVVLWVSSYCASTLRPLKSSLQKKKKKKKDTTAVTVSAFSLTDPYTRGSCVQK